MNITETEEPIKIIAKTCGCRDKNKERVTYQLSLNVDDINAKILESMQEIR